MDRTEDRWKGSGLHVLANNKGYQVPTKLSSDERIDIVLEDIARGDEPSYKLTWAEANAAIGDFYLASGGGALLDYPDSVRKQVNLCVMQTANVYYSLHEGLSPGVEPRYTEVDEVDPVIELLMIGLNDTLNDLDRQTLLQYIPRLLNTRVSEKTERRIKILREVYTDLNWGWYKAHGEYPREVIDLSGPLTKAEFVSDIDTNFDMNMALDGGSIFLQNLREYESMDSVHELINRLLRAR